MYVRYIKGAQHFLALGKFHQKFMQPLSLMKLAFIQTGRGVNESGSHSRRDLIVRFHNSCQLHLFGGSYLLACFLLYFPFLYHLSALGLSSTLAAASTSTLALVINQLVASSTSCRFIFLALLFVDATAAAAAAVCCTLTFHIPTHTHSLISLWHHLVLSIPQSGPSAQSPVLYFRHIIFYVEVSRAEKCAHKENFHYFSTIIDRQIEWATSLPFPPPFPVSLDV